MINGEDSDNSESIILLYGPFVVLFLIAIIGYAIQNNSLNNSAKEK